MKKSCCSAVALVTLLSVSAAAWSDERSEYNRRAAERVIALFKSLDRNADGSVTRDEARGDVNFVPRFDDMDINRDNIVTSEELKRFVELQFGVNTVQATAAPDATAQTPAPAR